MGQNAKILHQFVSGLKQDLDDNAEKNDSYQEGINGRLYSKNGVLSYSSIQGTIEVYNNPNIVKYLGFWPFLDQLAVFVKHIPTDDIPEDPGYSDASKTVLTSLTFEIDVPFGSNSISFLSDVHSNTTADTVTTPVKNPNPVVDDDYDTTLSCEDNNIETIDHSDYFDLFETSNDDTCALELLDETPLHNEDFSDAMYLISKDINGNFTGVKKYEGYLNWDPNRKIITYGLKENNFYQRVYFTDYLNAFRVVNFKDNLLPNRLRAEFDVFQGGANLSPQIHEISDGGQIKTCTVFYSYRLITANGQATIFALPSRGLVIPYNSNNLSFRGGDVDEVTSKRVTIQCNVVDYEKFQEIEAVAIEYSAKNIITAIRNLGTKDVNEVNYFDHVGTEADLSDNITEADIFERSSYWKYCSDLESIGNVLFASGIRNEPLPAEILNIGKDFLLHSWNAAGETHDCLINPEPWNYRYFDPSNTDDYYFVNKKRYNSIQVFGSYTVALTNKVTDDFYEQSFILSENDYVLQTEEIYNWLAVAEVDVDFATKFPNLKFRYENGNLFFDPIDDLIETDISDYYLKFNTTQAVQDIDEEVILKNLSIGTSNLTYGGISLGYNRGNGIRVSFKTEQDVLLKSKPTDIYPNDSTILDLEAPSLKKSAVKGEIYRLGLKFLDLKGSELFVLPLGDVMVPEFGEPQIEFEQETGLIITLGTKYRNSVEDDNKLYAERLVFEIDVKLSCETMRHVSMFQLMYVPRTENNRTILCQGISAPLERCNEFPQYFETNRVVITPNCANKWNLPMAGGPTIDVKGLFQYDIDPYQEDEVDQDKRITAHRALFYFDSPDIIYNKISANLIKSSSVKRVARLNQDYRNKFVRADAITETSAEYTPRFSRRILTPEIKGNSHPTRLVNVSVFALEREGETDEIPIEYAETLNKGQIIPGINFGVPQEISNYAHTLGEQQYFYTREFRQFDVCGAGANRWKFEFFDTSSHSVGYKTTIIKTQADVFTDAFIDSAKIVIPGYDDYWGFSTKDTHALINICTGIRETIYGGRSEYAYTKNVYKPLSDTIPVLKTSVAVQKFYVEGDVYLPLHIRLKNDMTEPTFNDGGEKNPQAPCDNTFRSYVRTGAWAYAYVVESEVEPRLTSELPFYASGAPHDFALEREELMNEAYFQDYIKNSIPQPFRFKDDPNLFNIISASKTKLSGEFFDSWTQFPVNNFYELERDKGAVLNLAKNINDLYAIQEEQTSRLIVDPRTMIPTADGEISIQQTGTGGPIADHDIVSNYGTAVRRAIVPNDFGFKFIDEKRFEFIQINKPLLLPNLLGFFLRNLFKDNPIIDHEGYFDDQHKETNILIKGNDGYSVMLSYNEALSVFNGKIDYNNSIYMPWNDDVLVPKNDVLPYEEGTRPNESSLHALNISNELNFFGDQKTMKIGVTSHLKPSEVLIFKHWAADMNIDYAIKQIDISTRLGHVRTIQGDHHRYNIREGIHSVPLKNRNDIDDLRGKWMYIEVEVESINNSKIDIFSFINFVRNSYI